jgi:hypothetical protein
MAHPTGIEPVFWIGETFIATVPLGVSPAIRDLRLRDSTIHRAPKLGRRARHDLRQRLFGH